MGWFDEQIRERKKNDEEVFEESFIDIAGAVMGRRVRAALRDERRSSRDAVDEILKFYHLKSRDLPDNIRDPEEMLEYQLRPYGIMRREVTLKEDWYRDAIGPMLGVRKKDGALVSLIPSNTGGYVYTDGDTGRRVKVGASDRDRFEEEAMVFYRPFPLRSMGMKDLVAFILGTLSSADIAMVVAATALVTFIGMLIPKINNIVFSKVILSGSTETLAGIAVFLACVGISMQIFNAVRTILTVRIETRMSIYVQSASMMRVLSLPAGFFRDYGSGELSTKLDYINSLCSMLVNVVMSAGLSSVFSLVYVGQIFSYTPTLALPAILTIAVLVAVSTASSLVQIRINRERLELQSKETGMGYAMISGIQKIRLAGAEKRAFARWGNLYAKKAGYTYDPPLIIKINPVLITTVSMAGLALLQFMAAKNGVSVADYFAFNTAYAMVSGAFMSLAGIALQVAQIRPVLEQVKPIFDAEPEISEGKQMVTRLHGGIELNNVSFRYDDSMPYVLDDVSLKIRPGQYVAIVGKTGCGKTTLMRLLLGFEKPDKGAIYYDGRDMASLDLKSLRRRIGSVTQNGKLFQGDLYDNITISAPGLSMEEAMEAADAAGLKEDIEDMPMGLYTMVAEGGGGISGGQKQRIMIARAIAGKPRILMFDEATSALDNITQKKVSDSLASLKCTRLVIAHRLSTIKECDRIIVLHKGKIIEDGTYDELMEEKGYFSELVERQRVDA